MGDILHAGGSEKEDMIFECSSLWQIIKWMPL